jgi:DNA-cytosine methyltransferase
MNNPLRIGTDCSGIESPIQALQQLGVSFTHEWCSEIDKYCIKSIKANYKPKRIYGDPDGDYKDGNICNRDHSTLPDIDLYVCGFPCQPFSNAGSKQGFNDKRGSVFWSCLNTIKIKQPKYFVLENVKGILSNDKKNKRNKYGQTWETIWTNILSLQELGYTVSWKILNTRKYGIPHNRERVYIVGTKKDFIWPEEILCKDINKYVEWDIQDGTPTKCALLTQEYLDQLPTGSAFIDLGFIKYTNYPDSHKFSPCILRESSIWCVPLCRYSTIKERLSLQGIVGFKQVVSNTQCSYQIGNSMSVNVVKAIIANLIA